jgi:hypothetical protein
LTAQHRKPVTITRIYTGSDGETHAEEITGNLKSDPSRNSIEFSDPIKVTSLRRVPNGSGNSRTSLSELHIAMLPRRLG